MLLMLLSAAVVLLSTAIVVTGAATGPGLTDCHDHYFIMDGPGITLSSESRLRDRCANVIIVKIPRELA